MSVVPFAFTGAPETWAVGVLRASEWFPRAGPGPRSVSIVDRLVVDGAVLLWVSIGGPPARPVLLAARRDGARLELTSTAAAIAPLADRVAWPTAAGGIVHWSGLPGPARFIGQVRATATNDVARIALGGRDALLKAYRVVGDGQAEEQALAAASAGRMVPRVLARVGYRAAVCADERLIALVTESVAGQTLDVPLRHSLQQAWQAGRARPGPADLSLLHSVRAALETLHGQLAPLGPVTSRPLALRLPGVLTDINVVRELLPYVVPDSGTQGRAPAARRLLDLAAGRAATLAAVGEFRTAPAHGDLHLSHVLVDREQIRFVDLTGPVTAPSPLDDQAALHRAVECLCLDLQIALAAEATRAGQHDIATALRAAALAADGGQAGLALAMAGSSTARLAERWCAHVVAELAGPRRGPAGELFYLARLLHDLRYHAERAATYYADLAWWHLSRLLTPRTGHRRGAAA